MDNSPLEILFSTGRRERQLPLGEELTPSELVNRCVVNMFLVNLCIEYVPCELVISELVNLCVVNMFLVNLCIEYVPCD